MTWVLQAKNVWDVVEAPATPEKKKDDQLAKALIGMNVAKQHQALVHAATSAHKAWESLAALFRGKSAGRQLQALGAITTLTMAPKESIMTYISRGNAGWRELIDVGGLMDESAAVQLMLKGLRAEYRSISTTIVVQAGTTGKLTFSDVQTQLMMADSMMGSEGGKSLMSADSAAAFYSGGRGAGGQGRTLDCWWCGELGHIREDCPKKKAGEPRSYFGPGRGGSGRGGAGRGGRGRGGAGPSGKDTYLAGIAQSF